MSTTTCVLTLDPVDAAVREASRCRVVVALPGSVFFSMFFFIFCDPEPVKPFWDLLYSKRRDRHSTIQMSTVLNKVWELHFGPLHIRVMRSSLTYRTGSISFMDERRHHHGVHSRAGLAVAAHKISSVNRNFGKRCDTHWFCAGCFVAANLDWTNIPTVRPQLDRSLSGERPPLL